MPEAPAEPVPAPETDPPLGGALVRGLFYGSRLLSPARVDGYRKFCNKIYNATRFSLTYIRDEKPTGKPPAAPELLLNRWLLSRLSVAVTASTAGIDEYRLDDGAKALYGFFWDELCNGTSK